MMKRCSDESDTTSDTSESTSEEEEDNPVISAKSDKEFFNVLAALRNNEPSIYDKNAKFYYSEEEVGEEETLSTKTKSFTLTDYDAKVVTSKAEITDEDEMPPNFASYNEDKNNLKDEFKEIANDSDDDDIFVKKPHEINKESKAETESCDFDLTDDKEMFIRNYVRKQKWNDTEQADELGDHPDFFKRTLLVKVTMEDTDNDVQVANISREKDRDSKSYPRVCISSIRQNERANKRAGDRARVSAAKSLKETKRKEEISKKRNKKIADLKSKIKEMTKAAGLESGIDYGMFEGDFDSEIHEKFMKKIQETEYGPEDEKPIFDDNLSDDMGMIDDEYDEEEKYVRPKKKVKKSRVGDITKDEFEKANLLDPDAVQQIQNLDYVVDIVEDEELKFKYREVDSQDYGLSAYEILNATEAELNQWVGLKRVTRYMTKEEQDEEGRFWSRKANLEQRKKKIFRSLYSANNENDHGDITPMEGTKRLKKMNSKRRKKMKTKHLLLESGDNKAGTEVDVPTNTGGNNMTKEPKSAKTRKTNFNKKFKKGGLKVEDDRLAAYGLNPSKFRKMHTFTDTSLKYDID